MEVLSASSVPGTVSNRQHHDEGNGDTIGHARSIGKQEMA
jgi:hypothetical protein